MATARRNPRDFTGLQATKLAEENAEKLSERAGQITTVTAPEVFYDDDIESSPSISVGQVTVSTATKKVRVNTDVEDMTFGHGNNLTLERGRTYAVPVDLYNHLEEKGLVWH